MDHKYCIIPCDQLFFNAKYVLSDNWLSNQKFAPEIDLKCSTDLEQ